MKAPQSCPHVFLRNIDSTITWDEVHVLEGEGIIPSGAQICDQASLSP